MFYPLKCTTGILQLNIPQKFKKKKKLVLLNGFRNFED